MDFPDDADYLTARQTEYGLQLVLIVIDDPPAEPFVVHINDFHHVPGMEAAFDPFNANGKEAVASVNQRFSAPGSTTIRPSGEDIKPSHCFFIGREDRWVAK